MKTKRKTVLKIVYAGTPYRIERREQQHPEEGLIKRFFLIEGKGKYQKEVYVTHHFGDCVYHMFQREAGKKKSQLTLTGR